MVSKLLSLASFALAASQVYAAPLARRDVYEATLEWPNLEDYSVFQARYEQLHCATHRGAVREDADQFYWDCCHPITRDQTIDVLPESCGLKPSAAAVAPSSTVEATTSTPAPVVESPTVAPEVLPAVTSPAAEAPAPTPTPTPEAPAETPATPAPSPVTPPATGGQAGTATFYFQNGVAGACGDVHPDSDPIIALPIGQWGTGSYGEKSPLCGRQMTITNTQNGQSVVATVADGCPTCAPSQIDLSTGAFDALGPRDQGVLQVTYALI